MNWDSVILTVLGAFGAVAVFLGQLNDVLGKVPELIRALHAIHAAWRDGRVPAHDDRGRNALDPNEEGEEEAAP
ncbi:hypothetical protein ACWCP6_27570 [Streptomyces sp. NPDC002004]